jgi:hypothetical protein
MNKYKPNNNTINVSSEKSNISQKLELLEEIE